MNFYKEWGFTQNPFDTTPLAPSKQGSKLLVGRDEDIKKIGRRLDNTSKILTIEGMNGVGKTSLINVFLYRSLIEVCRTNVGPLFVPCNKFFQVDSRMDHASLYQQVFLEIAQSMIAWKGVIKALRGGNKFTADTSLKRFINFPVSSDISVGLNIFGSGASLGRSVSTNQSFAFEKIGFENSVRSWLNEVFPTPEAGGVVCVLDNLELLQSSSVARQRMEEFRDTIFNIGGVRWILCGSNGIVHGVLSSPRLDGRLHKPIVIEELKDSLADEIYQTRRKTFQESIHARLPISQNNFFEIFEMLNGNIRSALSDADEFCSWVADRVEDRDEFSDELFEGWLSSELEAIYEGVSRQMKPKSWEVFDKACELIEFTPSDCIEFGFDSPQAMRAHIRVLEQCGLVRSNVDDSDKRRKNTVVTSKGWKVRAYLDQFG
jgi:hypothetical protein